MIIQIANIVSGFALSAPKLAEFGAREAIEKIHAFLTPYLTTIGIAECVIGALALFDRMGILNLPLYNFGSSYPQAIPAILMGLLLASSTFEKNAHISSFIEKLKAHQTLLGFIGIAVGLGSLLFGCPLCL